MAEPAPSSALPFKGTMMGAAVSPEMIAAARAAQAQRAAEAAPPAPPVHGRTMIGVAASSLLAPGQAPVDASGAAPQPKTAPEVPAARARTMIGAATAPIPAETSGRISAGGTMVGVAMPGIAPTNAGARAPIPLEPSGRIPPGGTMLGVAVPGIAPTSPGGGPPASSGLPAPPVRGKLAHTAFAEAPPVLPLPAPYVDDVALPNAPARRSTNGVPIAVVVAIVAGLVLAGGLALFFLKPSAPPMTGQPRLDAQGNQVLHLRCENCADGTSVALETSSATFKAKEADLPLTKSLEVGENDLVLKVDRPGTGRDEEVKLAVPLGFYVRADLADIGAKPPVITVRVAAAPGTSVSVDGKPLALDAQGKGAYALDVTSETEGPAEDVKVIDRKIPYVVTLKGAAAQSGTVSARIAVVPLRIDEPSAHAIIAGGSFVVAGQTAAGASVAIDGKALAMQPDGSFADTRQAMNGDTAVEIRASAQGRAPRTAHVTVKKVPSLAAEAKAEEGTALLTYDQVAPDVAAKIGQRAVLAGDVVEARVSGHQTIALVSDARGCKSGPCLARVVAAEDAALTRGSSVRVYGTVTRAVATTGGKTVPEIQADLVVPGKR